MEAAVGGETDGRSDDPEVVGTSTRLRGWAAHEPGVASEPHVGMNRLQRVYEGVNQLKLRRIHPSLWERVG